MRNRLKDRGNRFVRRARWARNRRDRNGRERRRRVVNRRVEERGRTRRRSTDRRGRGKRNRIARQSGDDRQVRSNMQRVVHAESLLRGPTAESQHQLEWCADTKKIRSRRGSERMSRGGDSSLQTRYTLKDGGGRVRRHAMQTVNENREQRHVWK